MNNRQKRLCRALLDFYDESGAQPFPLAQLAKKTGYHSSDIYDKDSQSGDLWPFDPKARGNYAGLLSFTSGKHSTVSITPAGVVTLEKLCGEMPAATPEKVVDTPKPIAAPAKASASTNKPFPSAPRTVSSTAKPFPSAPSNKPLTAKPFPVPTPSVATAPKILPSGNLVEARARFRGWLEFDPEGKALAEQLSGIDLVEAAFDKFFGEFMQS